MQCIGSYDRCLGEGSLMLCDVMAKRRNARSTMRYLLNALTTSMYTPLVVVVHHCCNMIMLSRNRSPLNSCGTISFAHYIKSLNLNIPFIYPHVFRNKCLQVEDLLATHLAPVLVECRPLDDLWFQRIVRLGYELPGKCFDDCCRVDAM